MPHGRASYTPVVALDYAAKQLTFTTRLGDGNGTNHVAYVKVSCKDCGHRGSAILLFEAIGGSEDGNYVSGVVPFPPLTERLEVCAAVAYSSDAATNERQHPPSAPGGGACTNGWPPTLTLSS